ncbi:MAG: nucleoside-triphosphatase [Lachnospiraceae bacterium]|nr:nucleoside-triphosphatase [Lachnospiraceae bacterium]
MKRETNTPKPHIVLCAPKKTGKTTLIERIMLEAMESAVKPPIPVYGFQTKKFAGTDGINRIYMFPAGHVRTDSLPSDTCYLGSTCGRVMDVCTETFEIYGTALIRSARPGGLIIMDEIGHMEKDARLFLQAIFDALDGDIPILASVRYTDADAALYNQSDQAGSLGYLEQIKRHPHVQLYMLTEQNRDAAYAEIRDTIFGSIFDRKEEKDYEPNKSQKSSFSHNLL